LGLSEHTIKKYLLRIFDKVGISSRVELVSTPSPRRKSSSEWMPAPLTQKRPGRLQWHHAEKPGERPVTIPGSQFQSRVSRAGPSSLPSARAGAGLGRHLYRPAAFTVPSPCRRRRHRTRRLLFQVRFRQDLPNIHSPLWLNVLGILFAWPRYFRIPSHDAPHARLVAFAAVVCFGISGALILQASAAPFDRSAPLRSSSDNRLCQWRAGRPRPAEMDRPYRIVARQWSSSLRLVILSVARTCLY